MPPGAKHWASDRCHLEFNRDFTLREICSLMMQTFARRVSIQRCCHVCRFYSYKFVKRWLSCVR